MTKRTKAAAAAWALAALAGLATAACGGAAHGRGEGVVKEVRGAEGRIVIDHGDIPGIMRAMTMEFEVDPALLSGVDPGDRVEFYVDEPAPGRYRVTQLTETQ